MIGITCVGTYWSPWLPYTVASIYPICEKIYIGNAGLDINHPDQQQYLVPLPQVKKMVAEIDVDNKIVVVENFNPSEIAGRPVRMLTQFQAGKQTDPDWFDPRAISFSAALWQAKRDGGKHFMNIHSDEVMYDDNVALLASDGKKGRIAFQYEIARDAFTLSPQQPGAPFDDSVYTFMGVKNFQGLTQGCAPDISWHLVPAYNVHCIHARHANPPGLTDEERYQHYHGRCWFRYYTNEGLWGSELEERAHHTAMDMLTNEARIPPGTFKPPQTIIEGYEKHVRLHHV
jgi:hypothetical protein